MYTQLLCAKRFFLLGGQKLKRSLMADYLCSCLVKNCLPYFFFRFKLRNKQRLGI